MKIIIILLTIIALQSCKTTKPNYLSKNGFDLNGESFDFPQKDFKILGFGAYHGSSKTEDVEILLLESLVKNEAVKYYLPETDYSIGHYFNDYLQSGDTILLKDLVKNYGSRVPQERTIEVYEKWKNIKKLNDSLLAEDKIEVIGIDRLVNYKYLCRHLVDLLIEVSPNKLEVIAINNLMQEDTVDYSLSESSFVSKALQDFMKDYKHNPSEYKLDKTSRYEVDHLIKNLNYSFELYNNNRDKTMFDNYISLSTKYNFIENQQFLRMGFTHVCKEREGSSGYPYFLTRLIENDIYKNDQVISVIGYLTDSEVVWDEIYDEKGSYTGYTKEGGYGIGDYELEYFRGIQQLKNTKQSDKTLFRLNRKKSPYAILEPDLIEVIMKEDESNGEKVEGMSTLSFIDYAILISNSKASIPIFELK